LEVVQFLVERNPTALETVDRNGWLPLHYACRCNHVSLEVVQFLVERNPAAVGMADCSGYLPLHLACQTQASLEVVQFLVEKNPVALGTADCGGYLPFDIACHRDSTSFRVVASFGGTNSHHYQNYGRWRSIALALTLCMQPTGISSGGAVFAGN
jgi:ankyrin repeat protein